MHIATIDKGRSHLREVVVDGEAASWLTVIDYEMRVGSAAVKLGCCAHVETRRKFRQRGYMRKLMEDTVAYMRERGHVLSIITGIADFYGKFGYASCFPDRSLSVSVRDAEAAARETKPRAACRTRKLRRGDGRALLRTYNAAADGRFGALVREAAWFERAGRCGQDVFVATAGGGRAVGYASCGRQGDRLHVSEVAATTPDALPALLKRLAAEGVRRRVERMEIDALGDEPVAELCRRFGCRWTTTFHRNASTMMRVLDQDAVLRAMCGDFSRRLRGCPAAGRGGTLTIRTELGATTLKVARGRVTVAKRPGRRGGVRMTQPQLAQLLAGYRSVADVLAERRGRAGRRTRRLLEALFPPRPARLWAAHRYEELHLNPDDYPVPEA